MTEKSQYTGPDRRKERQSELSQIHRRLADGDARMGGFEALLKQNTEMTQKTSATVDRIEQNTSAFVAFSNDLLGGTRFLCRCAKAVQWVADMFRKNWALIGLVVVIYAYATHQEKLLDLLFALFKA